MLPTRFSAPIRYREGYARGSGSCWGTFRNARGLLGKRRAVGLGINGGFTTRFRPGPNAGKSFRDVPSSITRPKREN